MKNKDLQALLATLPDNLEVFVNNVSVEGAEVRTGRVRSSYMETIFKPLPQGKDEAIVLTRDTELSDGTLDKTTAFIHPGYE